MYYLTCLAGLFVIGCGISLSYFAFFSNDPAPIGVYPMLIPMILFAFGLGYWLITIGIEDYNSEKRYK